MATKWYLRNLTPTSPPSSGEKSSVLPVGTFKNGAPAEKALDPTKGASQTTLTVASLAQTAHQDEYLARFTSEAIAAGTYGSGSWTLAVNGRENNAAANSFFVASIYVWRPGTASVVGYIYDSDTHLSTELGNGVANVSHGKVITLAGANVTAQDGDVLVLEVWLGASQGGATSRTNTLYYNGTTDVTAGSTEASSAPYLSAPANIPRLRSLASGTGVASNASAATSAKATRVNRARPIASDVGVTDNASAASAATATVARNCRVGGKVPTANNATVAQVPTSVWGSGGLWLPPITADLIGAWDPEQSTLIESGGMVTGCSDLSGSGRDLEQPVSGQAIRVGAYTLNGHAAFDTSAGNVGIYTVTHDLYGTTTFSVIQLKPGANLGALTVVGYATGSDYEMASVAGSGFGGDFAFYAYDQSSQPFAAVGCLFGATYVVTARFGPSGGDKIRVNGTGSGFTGAFGAASASSGITLGGYGGGSGSTDAIFGPVYQYDAVLSDADCATIEAALVGRYS